MATKAIFTVASTFASQTMPIIPWHGFGVWRVTSMFLTLSPCTSTLRERQEVTSELYVLPGWPICHTFAQAALRLGRTQARRPGSAKILHLLHKSQDLRKLAQLDEHLQLRVKKNNMCAIHCPNSGRDTLSFYQQLSVYPLKNNWILRKTNFV